jgi:hypothetical protein
MIQQPKPSRRTSARPRRSTVTVREDMAVIRRDAAYVADAAFDRIQVATWSPRPAPPRQSARRSHHSACLPILAQRRRGGQPVCCSLARLNIGWRWVVQDYVPPLPLHRFHDEGREIGGHAVGRLPLDTHGPHTRLGQPRLRRRGVRQKIDSLRVVRATLQAEPAADMDLCQAEPALDGPLQGVAMPTGGRCGESDGARAAVCP